MVKLPAYQKIAFLASVFALCVVVLGAYTRLTDAGLGCPDWPGCYGQLIAPTSVNEISKANALFPQSEVHVVKAHTEMAHRYVAFTLACLIAFLGFTGIFKRRTLAIPVWLPVILMMLVIGQALLGMWTVTLKLLPLVVLAHLIGGFSTLSLVWLLWLYSSNIKIDRFQISPSLSFLAISATFMLIIQIILGGWTSANYAALICPDFPTCLGQWWHALSPKALNPLGGIGMEHPLAYMDSQEKITIHMLHRLGALITFLLGALLCIALYRNKNPLLKKFSYVIMALLLTQVVLGSANVIFSLPLLNAVSHHFVAAILLLSFLSLNFTLYKGQKNV